MGWSINPWRAALLAALVCALSACAALDRVISVTDPNTGEVVETTVGDLAADTVEDVGGTITGVLGDAVGVATGNPIVGAGAGAALLALLGAGASRMRRKRLG
jgi:hypothetical protein